MTSDIFTPDEKAILEPLNIKQIITRHPELVIKAHETANSYVDMLVSLGVSPTNTSARKNIKEFLEQRDLKPLQYRLYQATGSYSQNRSLTKEEVLKRFVADSKHLGTSLRQWVIRYNLLPYQCSTVGCLLANPKNLNWNGKPLTLDLDHIDGNNTNNQLSNLRWLCPNCHSQTETYKGKNRRLKDKPVLEKELAARRAAFEALPNANSLWEEMKNTTYSSVARKYGVTVHDLKVKLLEFKGEDSMVNHIQTMIQRKFAFKTVENHLTSNGGMPAGTTVKRYVSSSGITRTVKADYPPDDELLARIKTEGYEALSRELGVSGNAIRKYITHRLGYTPKRVKKSEQ